MAARVKSEFDKLREQVIAQNRRAYTVLRKEISTERRKAMATFKDLKTAVAKKAVHPRNVTKAQKVAERLRDFMESQVRQTPFGGRTIYRASFHAIKARASRIVKLLTVTDHREEKIKPSVKAKRKAKKRGVRAVLIALFALSTMTGCKQFAKDVAQKRAGMFGGDWIVVQYAMDGRPFHCWKLSGVSLSGTEGGSVDWKDSGNGHLVHLTGWENRVQVVGGDFDGAAEIVGVNASICKNGVYPSKE